MLGDRYQIALIALGGLATALTGYFFYQELFPEYRIYQNDYVALEDFRSTYTGQPPPQFKYGIKQIVMERADKGPALVDRCTSCHVALQFEHFSPTKISYDKNGKMLFDSKGKPLQVPNEDYIWKKLDEKIADLTDKKKNDALENNGQKAQVKANLKLAESYLGLKTAHVDGHIYDVTKVLRMHPLMGKETRPFEFHPIDEYGCVACHNGNGRGLTTEKSHGPVFDGKYEIEDIGYVPEFTEKDPDNDPQFSKVFNSKPGHELLFQTSPIYIGALMQAKCAQCHELNESVFFELPQNKGNEGAIESDLEANLLQHAKNADSYLENRNSENMQIGKINTDVDELLFNYKRGQQLFVSQACYACHKIAGFTRGGVGPELTQEGLSYPWFVKQSIVWPQADLKTSTMPNFKMDHDEVQDLLTYLFAQTGTRKTVGETAKKIALREWESGKKLPFEMPSTPLEQKDLRYAMSVFALEGCAACHRLKGFESDVGFAIEKKEQKPAFDALYAEKEWFRKLVPEEIIGTELVKVLEGHADEIDRRIVNGVRENALLEQIENLYPGSVESLYTHFKFAARAKNHEYQRLALEDPSKKIEAENLENNWKDRVHRVLMMYVQEYGLGRVVGPRPNWSGVYRSDEWLMEHFRNPSAHVARSIMPVFPFDDTKFYALTHMLDVLGVLNKNSIQEVFKEKGFNPELAYATFCSQCHGDHLHGNGPVAEWIYPVPKNLQNFEFMRSLTKERVIQSITHGVKGTPMPPWGELKGEIWKGAPIDGPVLTTDMISKLVDWLYSSLPGGTVIKGTEDVPKWHYSPQDFLKDLIEEGSLPKKRESGDKTSSNHLSLHPMLAALPKGEGLLASLSPPQQTKEDDSIQEIFDIRAAPLPGPENQGYYIKKKFYTEHNIEAGRQFFELNCAVCHGKDADGAGARAGLMQDAKPRMLINFDWLSSRDDLRLLRSIKFGVPGTSMNPWGDLTSALQRLQLVVFIRTLTEDKQSQSELNKAIWADFDVAENQIEGERSSNFAKLEKLNSELSNVLEQKKALYQEAVSGVKMDTTALNLFQNELSLLAEINALQLKDQKLVQLKNDLKEEKSLYQSLGRSVAGLNDDEGLLREFLNSLDLLNGRFSEDNAVLTFKLGPKTEEQIKASVQQMVDGLQEKIGPLTVEKNRLMGQLPSKSRDAALTALKNEIDSLTKIKDRLVQDSKTGEALREKQRNLLKDYTTSIKKPEA